MIDFQNWKKAWALLNARERRNAWVTLVVVVASALTSALMVGSILPFLSVLSDPDKISQNSTLAWAYSKFNFQSQYAFLVALGAASFTVIVVSSAIQIIKTYVVARFSMMGVHSISHRMMIAYLRQPYVFFLNRHTGEMGTRLLAESQQVVVQFIRPATELIASACTVIAIVGLLLWVNLPVAIIGISVLGGIYGIVYGYSRRFLRHHGSVRAASNSERYRIANEALGGIKDIKLLGRERSYAERYAGPSWRMARALMGVQVLSQLPQLALQAVTFGGIILLCLVLMDPDGLQAGTAIGNILPILGVFAFAGQKLMPELGRLYQALAKIQAAGAAVDVVYEDLVDKAGSGQLPRLAPSALGLKKHLVFSSVSYCYPGANVPGLHNVSLTIQAGERIGIVGSTGAGKTTFANLVLGLLPVSEGEILADGRPITEGYVRAWQQSVGYVPQDIFLTDSSILENIALGVPPAEIDEAAVHRAAKIAQIHDFICEEMASGYATTIGERGIRLSGGQRQRIGIARALYHDADLIVFDEATSALDNLTEREVMAAIEALPGGKTVLMIAHRLTTVKSCDRIIVFEQGLVAACDTWSTLLESSSAFQRIANAGNTDSG